MSDTVEAPGQKRKAEESLVDLSETKKQKPLAFDESLITCNICLDIMESPAVLPCGHTNCLKCILQIAETDSRPKCPHCREVFSLIDLKKNWTLNQIIESITGKEDIGFKIYNLVRKTSRKESLKYVNKLSKVLNSGSMIKLLPLLTNFCQKLNIGLTRIDSYETLNLEDVNEILEILRVWVNGVSDLQEITEKLRSLVPEGSPWVPIVIYGRCNIAWMWPHYKTLFIDLDECSNKISIFLIKNDAPSIPRDDSIVIE